jgi:predicted deacylase
MTPLDAFSPDYATARRRFREAAGRFGWAVESHPIAATGPNGEELAVDVAAASGPGHEKTLVMSSGVHGTEGPFGSAVQLGLLEKWQARPPVRCVMIHTVNPFGFAHRRRFDNANIDLNRNFLLPGEEYRGAPAGYVALDRRLNPRHPPGRFDLFRLHAVLAVLRLGLPALQQAIAGGQYDFPKGIFFGGHEPAEATRIVTTRFDRWLGNARDIVHLDFHTGLGAWGTDKLLLERPPTDRERERLVAWFGPDSFSVPDSNGMVYDARGCFGRWCEAHRGDREYLFGTAEFGTYGPITALRGLKRENQAFYWGDPASAVTERTKRELAELFVPASAEWRERVVRRSWEMAERAATGLVGG